MKSTSLIVGLALLGSQAQAQWQLKPEFYYENRESGQQVYYSPAFYVELEPDSQNYKEYRYDSKYGKDYYWKNFDGGIYSERVFVARYNQLTYYTDSNDEFTDWGQQMGFAAAIAGVCCVLISVGVILTQCVVRRRNRMKELKAKKEIAELEGVDVEKEESSAAKSDSDEIKTIDPEQKSKSKKMSTKAKRAEALEKKAAEAKSGTVVADFSDEDVANPDGSQREMLNRDNDAVGDASPAGKKVVGNERFNLDQEANDAEKLPEDDEEGGGFF